MKGSHSKGGGRRRSLGIPRSHLALLAVVVLIGAVRGLFWTATVAVPTGDEAQHYSYVQTLAGGHAPPVTGRDLITQDAVRLLKNNHAILYDGPGDWRSQPFREDVHDPAWGVV